MRHNQKYFRFTSRWLIACGLALLLALLPLVPVSRHSSAAPISPDTSGLALTFTQVADSAMAIPGGTGTFTNFPYSPALTQNQNTASTSVSAPIEGWVDVLNSDQTEVVDSVFLSGNVHILAKVWRSSLTEVQRLKIEANLDDVSGTSPTTGQRYRGVGSSSVDLRNPPPTLLGDSWLAFPEQTFTFRLQRVDPEPARLNSSLTGSTAVLVSISSPTAPRRCQAIYDQNGNLTRYMRCPACPGDPDRGINPNPDCGYLSPTLVPHCSTPFYDPESGKVVEWICDYRACAAPPILFIGVSRFLRQSPPPCSFDICP